MHNEEALALVEMMDGLDALTDVAVDMIHHHSGYADIVRDVVVRLMAAATLLSHSDSIRKEDQYISGSLKKEEDQDRTEGGNEDIPLAERVAGETGYDEDTVSDILSSAYRFMRKRFDKEDEDE